MAPPYGAAGANKGGPRVPIECSTTCHGPHIVHSYLRSPWVRISEPWRHEFSSLSRRQLVGADIKDKLVELTTAFKATMAPPRLKLSEFVNAKKAEKADPKHSGDKLFELQTSVREYIKDFGKIPEYKNLKDAVETLRTYKKQTEAALAKQEAQTAKDEMRKARADGGVADGLTFDTKLGRAAKAYLQDIPKTDILAKGKYLNIKWNVECDLMNAPRPCAVAVGKDQLVGCVEAVKKLEYFENQKKWSADMMKSTKAPMATAIIVKPVIATKIRKLLCKEVAAFPYHHEKEWASEVLDTLQPQFTQSIGGSTKVQTCTDFGMVEIRLQIEGLEHVFVVPWVDLEGDNILAKQRSLADMTMPKFLERVEKGGFYCEQAVGSMLIIPGFVLVLLH